MTLLLSAALFLSSGSAASACPTRGWAVSKPEAEGLDAAVLSRLDEELASGRHGYVDRMLVIRNGRVVYEKSYERRLRPRCSPRLRTRCAGPTTTTIPTGIPYDTGSGPAHDAVGDARA